MGLVWWVSPVVDGLLNNSYYKEKLTARPHMYLTNNFYWLALVSLLPCLWTPTCGGTSQYNTIGIENFILLIYSSLFFLSVSAIDSYIMHVLLRLNSMMEYSFTINDGFIYTWPYRLIGLVLSYVMTCYKILCIVFLIFFSHYEFR